MIVVNILLVSIITIGHGKTTQYNRNDTFSADFCGYFPSESLAYTILVSVHCKDNLLRFIKAQEAYGIYDIAVNELEHGRKRSHWIWFVFPQMKGLGYSTILITTVSLARKRLRFILPMKYFTKALRKACLILLEQVKSGKSGMEILGGIDSHKVKSCLTLFDVVSLNDIFAECLNVCYSGKRNARTLSLLNINII